MRAVRSEAEQELLYEALTVIWRAQANRVIAAVVVVLGLIVGITAGCLVGGRHSLREMALLADGLTSEVRTNRVMIKDMRKQQHLTQHRYEVLLTAFENVKLHQSEDRRRAAKDRRGAREDRRRARQERRRAVPQR